MRRYVAGLLLGILVLLAPHAARPLLPPRPTPTAATPAECSPDFDAPPEADTLACWHALNAVGVTMCPPTMHPEWRAATGCP